MIAFARLVRVLSFERAYETLSALPEELHLRRTVLISKSLEILSEQNMRNLIVLSSFEGKIQANWIPQLIVDEPVTSLNNLMNAGLVERDAVLDAYTVPKIVADHIRRVYGLDTEVIELHSKLIADELNQLLKISDQIHFDQIREIEVDVIIAIKRIAHRDDDILWNTYIQLVEGIRDYLHFARQDWTNIGAMETLLAEIAQKNDDKLMLGKALSSLGAALGAMGQFDEAAEKCGEAILILSEINDSEQLSIAYSSCGFIARQRQDYEQAQEAYEQALSHAKNTKNVSLQVRILGILGTIQARAKHWDSAEQYQNEALNLCASLSTFERLNNELIIRNSLASYHLKRDSLEKALKLLLINFEQLRASDNLESHPLVLLQLARVLRKMGDFTRAAEIYQITLSLAESGGDYRVMAMCLRGLAKCAEDVSDYSVAIGYYEYAIEISKKLDDPYVIKLGEELRSLTNK